MRLINADRLKKSFEANTPIAFQDCVPGIHAIIDLEPTVEAIPVEWIKKWIFEHPYFCVTGSTLLGDWQKEQRKEE